MQVSRLFVCLAMEVRYNWYECMAWKQRTWKIHCCLLSSWSQSSSKYVVLKSFFCNRMRCTEMFYLISANCISVVWQLFFSVRLNSEILSVNYFSNSYHLRTRKVTCAKDCWLSCDQSASKLLKFGKSYDCQGKRIRNLWGEQSNLFHLVGFFVLRDQGMAQLRVISLHYPKY